MAEGGKKRDLESPYSDPVFKKISLKNGEINKLTYAKLKKLARSLNMCVEGSTDILRKRLKSHYSKMYLAEAAMKMPKKLYPYYIIIDFEATCEDKFSTKTDFPHEIIEFPAVVVNSETLVIDRIFHEYVKPSVNKTLSDYCTSLTGVTQSQVDSADPFPVVLQRFMEWMQQHNLTGKSAIVTDGPWDMARFLYMQVKQSKLPYPKFAKQWVNIKKIFSNFYNQRKPTLDGMLRQLNFEFEGRRHSGIDDSRNIARVLIQMLKDGAIVPVNERIDLSSFQSHGFFPINEIVRPVKIEANVCSKDEANVCSQDEANVCSQDEANVCSQDEANVCSQDEANVCSKDEANVCSKDEANVCSQDEANVCSQDEANVCSQDEANVCSKDEANVCSKDEANVCSKDEANVCSQDEANVCSQDEANVCSQDEANVCSKDEANVCSKDEANVCSKDEANVCSKDEANVCSKDEANVCSKDEANVCSKDEANVCSQDEANVCSQDEANVCSQDEANVCSQDEANVCSKDEANVCSKDEANVCSKDEANVCSKDEANVCSQDEANVCSQDEANVCSQDEANVCSKDEANVCSKDEANVCSKDEANVCSKDEANVCSKDEANVCSKDDLLKDQGMESDVINKNELEDRDSCCETIEKEVAVILDQNTSILSSLSLQAANGDVRECSSKSEGND